MEAATCRTDRLRPRTPASFLEGDQEDEGREEDLVTEEMLEDVEYLDRERLQGRRNPRRDSYLDLDQIVQVPRRTAEVRAQARRQAQGAGQAAHDRPGPEEAQGADLQRVRRYRPLPARRSSSKRASTDVEQIDSGSKKRPRRGHPSLRPLLQRLVQRRTGRRGT